MEYASGGGTAEWADALGSGLGGGADACRVFEMYSVLQFSAAALDRTALLQETVFTK
jgi:hypothetical protein